MKNQDTYPDYIVPQGNDPVSEKTRKEIILDFYYHWKQSNPSHRVFNISLRDYIYVRHISIDEAATHSSKRYLSTLAILQLTGVLANAKKVKEVRIKPNRNQEQFIRIIIMEYMCPGIGPVKLTVGVQRRSLLKIQYCITAIEA